MNADCHTPETSDPTAPAWVVAVDYESGAEVERRGPFTKRADIDEARKALREVWRAGRYVVWVRVE